MTAIVDAEYGLPQVSQRQDGERRAPRDIETAPAFAELAASVQVALETYSNVHRGSGHNSLVTTYLYERARDIVLEYLGLPKDKHVVIFCTPRRAELLKARLDPASYRSVSSQDFGLPLGVRAVAVATKALPGGAPWEAGGGTARLVAPGWVIWAKAPDKFEAGTPSVVNVIAFAKALQLVKQCGRDAFRAATDHTLAATNILCRDDLEKYTGRELLAELRQTLIGRSVRVPTMEGPKPYINLDNGASTPTFGPIWDAVRAAWRQPMQVQQEIIQDVKSICAEVLAAPVATYDVIFTSNTTEAINLVAESLHREAAQGSEAVVVNTLLEHNSNELPWRMIPGVTLVRLGVDAEGFVDLNELETVLRAYNQENQHGTQRIKLVTLSGASNVLGVCNDLAAISRIVHRYDARLLVDAAQLVAHRKVDMEASGIDYLVFSAHKVYAPFGTGALLARKGMLNFSPAELQAIRASGEENAAGIAALGKALVLLRRIGLDVIQEEEQVLTAQALRGMAQIPGVTLFGIKDPDSPSFAHKGGVIIFDVKGTMAGHVAQQLAARGIGVRSGCHCAHLLIKHVLHIPSLLEQFQGLLLTVLPRLSLPGVVRVSLGIENSAEDVDTLLQVLSEIARAPKARADVEGQMDEFVRAAAQRVYSPL